MMADYVRISIPEVNYKISVSKMSQFMSMGIILEA